MSEKATINLSVFKRLIAYAKPYKGILLLAVLSTLTLSILGPTRPALIGNMVNNYIIQHQDGNMLFFWSMIIIGMLLLEGVLQFTSSYLSNLLAQSVISDIRQKIFGHILSFRMRYFDGTPIGALVTRVVSDLEAITEVFSAGLMDIAGDLLSLIIILIWMFTSNWELSIMVIIPIPILLFATRIFARAMRDSFQLERAQVTKLNNFVQERLTGMNIVQLFNREKQEYAGEWLIKGGNYRKGLKAYFAKGSKGSEIQLQEAITDLGLEFASFPLYHMSFVNNNKKGPVYQDPIGYNSKQAAYGGSASNPSQSKFCAQDSAKALIETWKNLNKGKKPEFEYETIDKTTNQSNVS